MSEKSLLGKWSSKWLSVAKEKALETVDLVKRDLSELKDELSAVGDSVAGQMNEENLAWARQMVSTSMKAAMTTVQAFAGQNTYLDEDQFTETISKDFLMENSAEYDQWKEDFNLGEQVAAIRELMAQDEELRKKFLEKVPASMNSFEFWSRYFYAKEGRTVVSQPGAELELSSTQEDEDEDPADWSDEKIDDWPNWDD